IALEADETLAAQVADRHALAPRQFVVRTTYEDQPVAAKRDDFDLRARDRVSDNANVYRVVDDIFVDFIGATVFDVNVGVRKILDELFDDGRQLVQANRIDRRHAHLAADRIAHAFHLVVERVEAFDDFAAALIKRQAGGRRHQSAAATALDQAFLETIFKGAHLLADRRLRDEILGRCFRETARVDQVAKDFERFDVHNVTL